jgi:hypothetical protein
MVRGFMIHEREFGGWLEYTVSARSPVLEPGLQARVIPELKTDPSILMYCTFRITPGVTVRVVVHGSKAGKTE